MNIECRLYQNKEWKYPEEEILVNMNIESTKLEILKAKKLRNGKLERSQHLQEVKNEEQNTLSAPWVISKKNNNRNQYTKLDW